MCINTFLRRLGAVLVTTLAVAGCTLDKQEAPALVGPSAAALSIVMTASPDQLPRDAASVSVVTLRARDAGGNPLAGQRVALTLPTNAPSGARLSTTEVTTDAGGSATFSVSAPSTGSLGNIVILATPVGADANNAIARTISISALPGNDTAPTVPAFTFTPEAPERGEAVTFTATATDEGVSCSNLCTFAWNFGDGTSATGTVVTKSFTEVASHQVTLTVTDRAGTQTVRTQTIAVGSVEPPTVSFVMENSAGTVITSPITGQETTFRATAAASGNARIVSYSWSWGDGTSSQTSQPVVRHAFAEAGQYLVQVTVTDSLGQRTTTPTLVTVGSGVTASFTATQVGTTTRFNFDGTLSSSQFGSIVSYTWDFGDGTTTTTTVPTTSRTYAAGLGVVTVRLTVTDSADRTGTVTRTITVP